MGDWKLGAARIGGVDAGWRGYDMRTEDLYLSS